MKLSGKIQVRSRKQTHENAFHIFENDVTTYYKLVHEKQRNEMRRTKSKEKKRKVRYILCSIH